MKYLPVALDLQGRMCVVVGAGPVGTRKASLLTRAGASVTVVAPEVTEELRRLAEDGSVRWRRVGYDAFELDDAFLVVAATDDQALNARIVEEAREKRILVCDASSAARSQVIFGALHEEEELTVAVFTDGTNPARARKVRDRIAELSERWGTR